MKKIYKIVTGLLFLITGLMLMNIEAQILANLAFSQYAVGASQIIFGLSIVTLLYALKVKGYAFDVNAGVGLARNRIVSTFDIMKPEVRNQLMRSRGDQGFSFFGLLDSLGNTRPVQRDSSLTYEEDWIHQLIYVGSGGMTGDASYASNGIFSFVLSAAATTNTYLPYATAAPYTNSASTSLYAVPVQINDRIRFEENYAVAHVYNITGAGTNAVTLWCKMTDVTKNITLANYPAGTTLPVMTNAWSDGSKMPRGNNTNVRKNYSYTQIVKTGFSLDGATQTNQLWFTEYYNGKSIIGYQVLGQDNAEYEHMGKLDQLTMWEQLNANNIMDPLTDEPNRSTEGLVPYIKRTGNTLQSLPGSFSESTFDTVASILEKQFCPAHLMWMTGFDIDTEINNTLKDYFQNTMVDYTKKITVDLFQGNDALSASVNFRGFQKGRFTHSFIQNPMFSHPRYVPVGYKTPNMALVLPMGRTMDPKLNMDLPYVGSIYKSMGTVDGVTNSRKMKVEFLHGVGVEGPGRPIMEDDLGLLCMLSEVGNEFNGGNRMMIIEGK